MVVKKSVFFVWCLTVVGSISWVNPTLACYPGYSPPDTVVGLPSSLQDYQGKTTEKMLSLNQKYPQLVLESAIIPGISNWMVFKASGDGVNSVNDLLGLYFVQDNKVKGYALLEAVRDEPCARKSFVQQELQDKSLVSNYLSLQVPADYQLNFYEKRQGNQIFQTAVFSLPLVEHVQELQGLNHYVVMQAKYHKDLEPFAKSEMQKYFQANMAGWVDTLRLPYIE